MKKISLSMGVMCWWEQACEKHGTLVSPELRKAVQHLLLAMTFMQTDASMRGLCASSLSDFVDIGWEQLCFLLYLLGKCGLRIEMSREEMDEYEGKAVPKPNAIDWEQRRWELANRLYFWSEFQGHWKDAIEQADLLIEQYKQTNTKHGEMIMEKFERVADAASEVYQHLVGFEETIHELSYKAQMTFNFIVIKKEATPEWLDEQAETIKRVLPQVLRDIENWKKELQSEEE